MNFFVIPYLVAVDIVVPATDYHCKPIFYFDVAINSTAELVNSSGISTDYRLTALMRCTPDPVSLWCFFEDTKIVHGQKLKNYSSSTIRAPDDSFRTGLSSITNESFLLEFDKTGVKISSCSEKSERSLRMIQKIADLLFLDDVAFDSEKRGASTLETVTIVDDCPLTTTRVNYQPIGTTGKKPGEGYFKIMSHPDRFDETTKWILEINRKKDISNCNYRDYFFGSRGDNDVLNGSKLIFNITSSTNNIRITNEEFVSVGQTEGTITSRTMKFLTKDTISVSTKLNKIFMMYS